ncbi:hypothetical protein BC939DRAFT_528884 [Gamsiella multidivaricata]|uniref:uncharacterized protein n=1 Tax=Gamsiella multidivaricata TaxID=101098 RepID=UPI00221E51D0|nr:uncharacterized protein BC939DRAFT_528884 [Gamsiella multidivaricata]KAG0365678.1 hypothetical protein BGZ54_006313 [Gamsiella multidivaricata]KAI7823555.1 hypothetical protein BC939DRAFT_528884 [Gamsiella multidivaricata]
MPPKKAVAMGSKSNKRQKLDDHSASAADTSDKVLSKEEEEEMSSALIAQLLAQEGGDDHAYYAEYNNDTNYGSLGDADYSDDDDDYRNDYNYRPKSKSRRSGGHARKRTKKAPPPPPPPSKPTPKKAAVTNASESTIDTASTSDSTVVVADSADPPVSKASMDDQSTKVPASTSVTSSTPAAPPKEKKIKETAPTTKTAVYNTGVYSDVEERAFVEALDIFGRNWRRVEEHVATRDANSIRSHAQKHFIKLFRDNIPLPPKVLETGPGYTLSGNDLDPYSSAARPYLSQRALDDPSLLPAQGGTIFTPQSGALAKAERALAKEKKAAVPAENVKESAKDAVVKEMKELRIRKPTKPTKESSSSLSDLAYAGRTDYSKARLRNVRERPSINYRQAAADLDPLTMVKCEPFCGQPNSGVLGCQPFGIKVQSNVLLGMDFHAHLMTSEIIGFLAGEWDVATRTIHIKAIFPCRSLPTGQNHINVEMDPTSEFEVRQEIEKKNMRIVGWYHSHPTFTPDPSLVDIENQTNYQSLFKDESMNEEPFVGAIVGPYDEHLPGLSSVINWFYISQLPQERGHPKRLLYDLIEDAELPEEEMGTWTKLFDEYRDSPERINFKEQWRHEESETKLQKMLVSLGRRMPWLKNSLLKGKDSKDSSDDAGTADDSNVALESDATEMADVVGEKAEEELNAPKDSTAGEIISTSESPDNETSMDGVEPNGQDFMEGSFTSDATNGHALERSLSNESSESSGSKSLMGLGSLINDPFLIRVEQELAAWEPVAV